MEKIKYKRGVIAGEDETGNEKIEIDPSRMKNVRDVNCNFKFGNATVNLDKRTAGDFAGKGIYLTGIYDWVLCRDDEGGRCLIPLKKETG